MKYLVWLGTRLGVGSCAGAKRADTAGRAEPYTVKGPVERSDPYYWLRDDTRKNPEMLAYLNAENAYADAMLAPKPLQEQLYKEIVGRIKQDDSSVPYHERGYWYYSRYETGKDYPIHARKAGRWRRRGSAARRQRDGRRARLFRVGDWEVSQDNHLLAWAEDTVGRRQYTMRFKDLATGEMLADAVANIEPEPRVGRRQQDALLRRERPGNAAHQAREDARARHAGVGRRLVYEEKDDSFYMGVGRTRDDKYICILRQHRRATRCAAPRRQSRRVGGGRAARATFHYEADHHRRPLGHPHQLGTRRTTS